jgi:hypothetical protein
LATTALGETHPLDVWCGMGLGARNDNHRVDRRSLKREISTVSIKIFKLIFDEKVMEKLR